MEKVRKVQARPELDFTDPNPARVLHLSAFVTQIIAQRDPACTSQATAASNSYEKADALNGTRFQWLSASL